MPRPKMGGISKSAVMPKSRPITTGGPTPRRPKLLTTAGPKLPTTAGPKTPSAMIKQQQKAQATAPSRRGRMRRAEGGVATAMKTAKPC